MLDLLKLQQAKWEGSRMMKPHGGTYQRKTGMFQAQTGLGDLTCGHLGVRLVEKSHHPLLPPPLLQQDTAQVSELQARRSGRASRRDGRAPECRCMCQHHGAAGSGGSGQPRTTHCCRATYALFGEL